MFPVPPGAIETTPLIFSPVILILEIYASSVPVILMEPSPWEITAPEEDKSPVSKAPMVSGVMAFATIPIKWPLISLVIACIKLLLVAARPVMAFVTPECTVQ